MKVAVDKDLLKIVDILPDNATENHAYLKAHGYVMLEIESPYLEDGGFRHLSNYEMTQVSKSYVLLEIDKLEYSLLRPMRELLAKDTPEDVKEIAQNKVDNVEKEIHDLRARLK